MLAFVLATAGACGEAGVPTRITSWNTYSKQFIDAPEFWLLAIPATAEYRAVVEQGSRSWTVRSQRPEVSLAAIWRRVAAFDSHQRSVASLLSLGGRGRF